MFREIFDYFVSCIRHYFVEEAEFITDDIISIPYYWCGKKYKVYCRYDKELLNVPEDVKIYLVRGNYSYDITQQPGIPYNDLNCDKYIVKNDNVDFFTQNINSALKGMINFFNE